MSILAMPNLHQTHILYFYNCKLGKCWKEEDIWHQWRKIVPSWFLCMYIFSISRTFRKCYVFEVVWSLRWWKLKFCISFFENNGKIQLNFLNSCFVKFLKVKSEYCSINFTGILASLHCFLVTQPFTGPETCLTLICQ